MEASEAVPHIAVFLVVVLLLGVVPSLPAAPEEPSETGFSAESYTSFQPDRILTQPPEAEGQVTMDAHTRRKLILIDVEHNNRFSGADLEPLVTALEQRGHEVRYFDTDTAKPGGITVALEDADAFVVINPGQRFEVSEADAVEAFVQDGGRLLLVGRPTAEQRGPFGFRSTGVRNGHAGLAGRFGVTFESGTLYNMRTNQNNYQSIYASPRVDDPITDAVDRVVFRQATPVHVTRGTILLRAEPGTRLDTTRDRAQYPIMVRTPRVVAVGDGTFLFPENAGVADNEALIGNVADFLVTGQREADPEAPTNATEPPTDDGPSDGAATPTDDGGATEAAVRAPTAPVSRVATEL